MHAVKIHLSADVLITIGIVDFLLSDFRIYWNKDTDIQLDGVFLASQKRFASRFFGRLKAQLK